MPAEADPALVEIWAQGWALTREVAPPVAVSGGWRIEVGLPDQLRRFVYPPPSDAVAERGRSIDQPFEFIKVATSRDKGQPLLDDRWAFGPPGYMMTRDPIVPAPRDALHEIPPLPGGERVGRGAATNDTARGHPSPRPSPQRGEGEEELLSCPLTLEAITDHLTLATILAPNGELAASGRLDLIGDVANHAGAARWVLVATPQGRALYEALGWAVHTPYTSAFIPPA